MQAVWSIDSIRFKWKGFYAILCRQYIRIIMSVRLIGSLTRIFWLRSFFGSQNLDSHDTGALDHVGVKNFANFFKRAFIVQLSKIHFIYWDKLIIYAKPSILKKKFRVTISRTKFLGVIGVIVVVFVLLQVHKDD